MLVDEAQGSWSADEVCASATDILAVDWLDENVVVAGGRDGAVRLWDARSRGKSTRLQFPSCISHVKAVGGSRIVVAGLGDNVSFYYLNFLGSDSLQLLYGHSDTRELGDHGSLCYGADPILWHRLLHPLILRLASLI